MKLEVDRYDLAQQWQDLLPDSVEFRHFDDKAKAMILFMQGAQFCYPDELTDELTEFRYIKVPEPVKVEVPNFHNSEAVIDVEKKVVVDYKALQAKIKEKLLAGAADEHRVHRVGTGDRHVKLAAQIHGCEEKDVTPEQRTWAKAVAFHDSYSRTGRLPCDVCCGAGCEECRGTGFANFTSFDLSLTVDVEAEPEPVTPLVMQRVKIAADCARCNRALFRFFIKSHWDETIKCMHCGAVHEPMTKGFSRLFTLDSNTNEKDE